MPKVLLISPPWRQPSNSSLALGTLRPILEKAGIATENLYGNLLFPLTPSAGVLESWASWLFLPCLYPQVSRQQAVQAMMRQLLDDYNMQGARFPRYQVSYADLGMDASVIYAQAMDNMARAEQCIERCVQKAANAEYDIVGLSATFETQLPAALAIARCLRALRPDVRLIIGGAACFEVQGDGLAASFPELDAVCHSEGEEVIVPLIRALRGQQPLAGVPGIVYRDPDAPGGLRRTPAPVLLRDMDQLPIPVYDDFLEQFAQSEWSAAPGDLRDPQLFFETSRGCWWGQKHLCSFCGLNADGLIYRKKSAGRVYDEISHLYHRYPQVRYFQATDNILDMGFLKDPLPRLAPLAQDPQRPLKMFFEAKSNLRPDQVCVLAKGGITSVQPGIESFSDAILERMDKGATGLSQIQFLKNAYESGINPVYNILIRNPGDRPEDYQEMLDLLPFIEHLPPPMAIVACLLERFSPYHKAPDRYGIRQVRPKAYYRDLYPDPQVDLERIAYIFEYDHDMLRDDALWQAQRAFVARAVAWTEHWQPGTASYVEHEGSILIQDGRPGAAVSETLLSGAAARVFRYLERVRVFSHIEQHFASLDRGMLQSLLATWLHRRWIVRDRRDRYLSVLPRFGAPSAVLDAAEADSPAASKPTAPRRLPLLAHS